MSYHLPFIHKTSVFLFCYFMPFLINASSLDTTLAKQIFAKAKAYHKRDLIEMQWESAGYISSSSDTSKYSLSYIQNFEQFFRHV
jgi:hypothetical protein